MKYFQTFAFLGLLLIVSATLDKYDFASLAELNDITQTSFGKNLYDTIAISLNSGGDSKTVLDLLKGLRDRLNGDQIKSDQAWVKEKKRLIEKIDKLTREIKELTAKIDDLEDQRIKKEKLINRVKANIAQYKSQKAENLKQEISLDKKRIDDHSDYKRSSSEHLDISNAINQVLKELNQLKGSISGRGKPAHVGEIAEEKRDGAWEKSQLKKSFLEITKDEGAADMFVQMATEADQKSLETLIGLLQKLLRSTEKSYNDDKAAEAKSLENYNLLKNALHQDNKKLDKMIADSEKNLALYNDQLKKIIKQIGDLKTLRASKQKEKEDTIREKDLKEKAYFTEKEERTEERRVVEKLIDIVEKRLKNMSEYVSKNTGA
jgi:hypothetical protein